jgi:hypothetical protein
MGYTQDSWAKKREQGLVRFLIIDGVLFTGGPFAVILQVVGYFLLADEGQTFGQYFTSTRTWMTFFFHGTLFGGIMGFVKWRRYEKAYLAAVGHSAE